MESLKSTIAKMISCGEYSYIMNKALSLIIEDKMNSIALNQLLANNGISITELKEESLVVIIDYANKILEDDILTDEEMKNIGLLKLFFKIEPHDFTIFGKSSTLKQLKLYIDVSVLNETSLLS